MSDLTFICEWGQSHQGKLDLAIRQAQTAHDAGWTFSKWQMFETKNLVSREAKRYWDPELGGHESQFDTFEANGHLTTADWYELKAFCDSIGHGFLATPFDLPSVDLLEDLGATHYKIASGDVTWRQLLVRVAQTGKPVFLSTGAANPREIYRALDWVAGCHVSLMMCSLAYPTKAEDANLARIEGLSGFPVSAIGISDHTLQLETAFGAALLGATVFERHATLNRGGPVPDDNMAVTPAELKEYCRLAHLGAAMKGTPYPGCSPAEEAARVGARRSLHAAKYFRRGHVFADGDFCALRPGDGSYEPADVDKLVGRKAARPIRVGTKLTSEDVCG